MVNADSTGLCPLEKLLVCATTAEECQVVLFGGSLTGCEMLDMLNEQGLSLLVYNNDSLSIHANRGVRDLLELLSAEPERLRGAIVADKVIGKAAAALMATGGVNPIYFYTTPQMKKPSVHDVIRLAGGDVIWTYAYLD